MLEKKYFVKGMHCKSCELLLESSIADMQGVKGVKADTSAGEVTIQYADHYPSAQQLTSSFKINGYSFSQQPFSDEKAGYFPYVIGGALILIFLGINKLGLAGALSVSKDSSFLLFIPFGLLAGFSTCAALVGGLVLSLSKYWKQDGGFYQKIAPHLKFNIGRAISFTLVGLILGALGSAVKLSPVFTAILVILVSIIMLLSGLQMLGVKFAQKFQLAAPKNISKKISDNKSGGYMPMTLGALTILLPCGFTLTAAGIAVISGSAMSGGLIMLAFALGTAVPLLLIGLSSAKLQENPKRAKAFSTAAGLLVLFFALFNVSNQINVLGISFGNPTVSAQQGSNSSEEGLPPIVNGKQIIKMNASDRGYSPNYFKVKAGVPVRWEITDVGTSGCTNAVISFKLFSGDIPLTYGQTSVKEFTPQTPGRYKFSCWMGMVSGMIEVVK